MRYRIPVLRRAPRVWFSEGGVPTWPSYDFLELDLSAPMGKATLDTISTLLKEFYLPAVVRQLNSPMVLRCLCGEPFTISFLEIDGRVVRPVPTADAWEAVVAAYCKLESTLPHKPNTTYHYGRIRISGTALARTRGNPNGVPAFLDLLQRELAQVGKDLKAQIVRDLYGGHDAYFIRYDLTTWAEVIEWLTTMLAHEPRPVDWLLPAVEANGWHYASVYEAVCKLGFLDMDEDGTEVLRLPQEHPLA